ncbi:MAG: DNA-3-methyladenine glycosylase 2 family protein [Planctomycetes bacterium]|nr:DNA-3-methyladenine glycosylase 2 family protein [Planctomycetota bacterium]NUQ34706.1 DNA-3-methyladenine glycosylase 2 family protein [Planctomycetaceae bacterium]
MAAGKHAIPFDSARACRELGRVDPALKALVRRVPFALTLRPSRSPFEALLQSIIYQQLSGKAAATIHGRVLDLFPSRARIAPAHLLRLSDGKLRGAGVSQGKLLALRDLATKTIEGVVPSYPALRRMEDEDIIEHLTQVRGVGRWTVQMLLMFRLGRPDVLPVDDLGVRHGFKLTYGKREMPTPKRLLAYGERWKPWRSVASWYMWRAVDLHRQENSR